MLLRSIALLASVACLFAGSEEYLISAKPGDLFALEVTKTGFLSGKKHRFVFEKYHGIIYFDRQTPENSKVEIAIEAASVVCQDTWVSAKDLKKIENLARNEMMQVVKYPQLLFSSSGVTPKSANEYAITGMLTIRGLAKPATVHVTLAHDSPGALSIAGRSEVKLTDYNLKPPSAALGTIGTKNEMAVEFRFALHK